MAVTTNYKFPIYEAMDKPNLLDQSNGAIKMIDTELKKQEGKHDELSGKVTSLESALNGKAPINHKSTETKYGVADDSNYGHVKLTTTVDETDRVPTAKAVSDAFRKYTLKDPKMVCIGDSFLEGYSPDGNVPSWGKLLGDLLGVEPNIFAKGGCGFVNSVSEKTFNVLINDAYNKVKDASLVIIGGGYNDSKSDLTTLSAAVTTAIQNAHQKWPNATIWVFPNLWGKNNYGINSEEHANAIVNAVKALGYKNVNYIMGCWTWLFGHDDWVSSDGLHPNQKGQEVIAQSMNCALNGGNPTVYSQDIKTTGAKHDRVSCTRNYLELVVNVDSVSGKTNDVLAKLPDNVNMKFTAVLGFGTISSSYKQVIYTGSDTEIKIFNAEGTIDANGYAVICAPMYQK